MSIQNYQSPSPRMDEITTLKDDSPISFTGLPETTHEPRYRTSVRVNRTVGARAFVLELERPQGFTFIPGQYVWLVMPERSKLVGQVDRHAYSLTSAVDADYLGFLIRTTESNYLKSVRALTPGDEVEIIGAFGSAFTPPPEGGIIIAGGVGVAPFLSVLRSNPSGQFSIFVFEVFDDEPWPLYCCDEMRTMLEPNGHIVRTFQGNPCDRDLANVVEERRGRPIYISGPQGFVDSVTNLLLAQGIDKNDLRYEAVYPSGELCKQLATLFVGERSVVPDTESIPPQLSDLFMLVARQTTNHLILTNCNGTILFANHAAEKITGYSFDEMRGETPRLWGGLMPGLGYRTRMWHALVKGAAVKGALLNRRKDGRLYVALNTVTPISYSGGVVGFISTEEDITYLHDMDKAKSEFVSLASHQLRTPLSIVNWYTEMLLDGETGEVSDKERSYINEIRRGSQRMVELVNAFLNVSRIELGIFEVEPTPTNLVELAEKVVRELQSDIDHRGHRLVTHFSSDIGIVNVDAKLVQIVLQNLLSNAIKYTLPGGSIEFDLLPDGENVKIRIADTGLGIPEDEQGRIFTKLFRADNAKQADNDGAGLGLYIVKSILDHAGGHTWFESETGKGTTFYVTIPREMRRVGRGQA